jgi:hypothetical protein
LGSIIKHPLSWVSIKFISMAISKINFNDNV